MVDDDDDDDDDGDNDNDDDDDDDDGDNDNDDDDDDDDDDGDNDNDDDDDDDDDEYDMSKNGGLAPQLALLYTKSDVESVDGGHRTKEMTRPVHVGIAFYVFPTFINRGGQNWDNLGTGNCVFLGLNNIEESILPGKSIYSIIYLILECYLSGMEHSISASVSVHTKVRSKSLLALLKQFH